jgi:hypothetical protein
MYLISGSKRFVNDKNAQELLQQRYDWNSPGLCFKGKTVARTTVHGQAVYEVVLDEALAISIRLSASCLKYLGQTSSEVNVVKWTTFLMKIVPRTKLINYRKWIALVKFLSIADFMELIDMPQLLWS